MNTAVVTSNPVIIASPVLEHPVTTRKKSIRGIGITGILIGLYAIGFGGYYLNLLRDAQGGNFRNIPNVYVYSYAWTMVGAGVWFVVAGSFAIAVSASASECHIVGGIVVAILASLAAFGLLMIEAAMVFFSFYSSCCDAEGFCGCSAGAIFAHTLMLVLAFIEFVLVIVQASYSCGCCGRCYTPTHTVHIPTATTVTTTSSGNRYAPLHNEQDGTYPAAYQPPQNPAAPPTYY